MQVRQPKIPPAAATAPADDHQRHRGPPPASPAASAGPTEHVSQVSLLRCGSGGGHCRRVGGHPHAEREEGVGEAGRLANIQHQVLEGVSVELAVGRHGSSTEARIEPVCELAA